MLLAAAPIMVRDPSPAAYFVEAGGKTFFAEYPSGLFVTNGTAGGTLVVKTFGQVGGLTGVDNEVYFTADGAVWRSDGTTTGTVQLVSIPVFGGDVPYGLGYVEIDGSVYFATTRDLWKTDGTPQGTTRLRSIVAKSLTRAGDTLYFIGRDDATGGETLWKSDGTPEGTMPVPGAGSMFSLSSERPMAPLGDKLLFAAFPGDGPARLYVTDGTPAGTTRIDRLPQVYGDLTNFNGSVYFAGADESGAGFWKSDGTAAGTGVVKELGGGGPGGAFGNRVWLTTRIGDLLYFIARDGSDRFNLWKSDGTPGGTVVVAGPTTGHRFTVIDHLTDVDGKLVFTAGDADVPSGAYSVWTSDGTAAGTTKVRDTFTGGEPYSYGLIGAAGSVALFTASGGADGPTLFAYQTADSPPVPEARTWTPTSYAVAEGGTLALHGYTSAEPLPGRPLTYAWDLDGDGVFGESGAAAARGDENGADPKFNAAGLDGPSTHAVRFRISDATGYVSTADVAISITNAAPTLNVAGGPAAVVQGTPYTLTLSSSDAGPDTITQWIVDWGDGVVQTLPGGTTSVSHVYPTQPRGYGVVVKARDEDGEYSAERPAAVDTNFGEGGKALSSSMEHTRVLVQPDGKILALGAVQDAPYYLETAIVVTRYNPDGTLDRTFGLNGVARLNPTTLGEGASGLALQPDGRILVTGTTRHSLFPYYFGTVMLRLLPDGSLDATFGGPSVGGVGGGPGWIVYDFGPYDALDQLIVRPDGRIVAGGRIDQSSLLVQFRPDGSLDPAFGNGGVATMPFLTNGGISDMALQPDGKLLAIAIGAGVLRFNPDGSLNTAFGRDGRAEIGAAPTRLGLLPDGRILLVGGELVRLNADGSPDESFGPGGVKRPQPTIPANPILKVLPDGRFVLTGFNFYVDRFLPNGDHDPAFGAQGISANPGGIGSDANLADMALQADGSPVLFGGAGTSHNPVGAVVRLTPTGLSVRVVDAAPPQLSVSAPTSVAETTTYTLGLGATDPDGDGIVQWIVDWGDGSVETGPGEPPASLAHVYPDGPRSVVVKASVLDGDGSLVGVSTNVSVENLSPIIYVMGERAVAEGSRYAIRFNASDRGRDVISAWRVDWGDGTGGGLPGSARTAEHIYQDQGEYTVVLTAVDEDGEHAATPLNVEVANVAPTLDALTDRVAAAKTGFDLVFTGRDVVPEVFDGTIDWGDGGPTTPFAGTPDAPQVLGRFTISHVYAARGTYDVTVRLSDGDGGVATRTAKVRVGDAVVRVFDDFNGDGLSGGDSPRSGVVAYLDLNRDGTLDADEPSGRTDFFGEALFDGLAAGSYAARVVVPPARHLSAPAAGFADVTPGGAAATATFGLTQATAVIGVLYDDANRNGVRDPGEGPVSGRVFARPVGDPNAVGVSTSAGADGVYRLRELQPGQYLIEWTNAPRVITAPYGRRGHVVTVTGAEAEIAGLDFGSYVGLGGRISGSLYRDRDGDGARDPDETGFSGQTIYIDANDNGVLDADEIFTFTDFRGNWVINRVTPGRHVVRQVPPAGGWRQTEPAGGDLVGRTVVMEEGQSATGVVFGATRPASTVVGRHVFYNRNGLSAGDRDALIAPDKLALAPGQAASFANITNHSRGINGIIIDIAGLSPDAVLTTDDFLFQVNAGGATSAWNLAAQPIELNVRRGAGVDGSDRVVVVWVDGDVRNCWLRVTVQATDRTGLSTPDVFHFGNLVGETGDNTTTASVTASDLVRVRNAVGRLADLDNPFDFDRNGVVNAADLVLVRNRVGSGLANFTAPGESSFALAIKKQNPIRVVPPARLAMTPLFSERSIGNSVDDSEEGKAVGQG